MSEINEGQGVGFTDVDSEQKRQGKAAWPGKTAKVVSIYLDQQKDLGSQDGKGERDEGDVSNWEL